MYFRRFYDERLAQASYLLGCQQSGTAIVIDPARAIDRYLEVAAAERLEITDVTETHIHADFVSGSRELAAATGAAIHLSGCGPAEWQYGYRSEPGVRVLADGTEIAIGNVRIRAVHTPGHTPEHLVFLVTDGAVADEPLGVVTGDFVFVNDVGRPDLLERAAKVTGTAEQGARALFRSLAWFKTLPDHLQVWPGHGAGSACGKGLGAMPQSTVGYERRFNWAFEEMPEERFVVRVLEGQPEPPRYFGRMKRVNRDGPPVLGRPPAPPLVTPESLDAALASGATVVDARPAPVYAAGHLPGTINVPWGRSFLTYAGSVVSYDEPVHLIVPRRAASVEEVVEALGSIGFDRVGGVGDESVVDAWASQGRRLGTIAEIGAEALADGPAEGTILIDVRNRSEWDAGHVPGARLIPLPELVERIDEIPDGEVVVHCQGGTRSAIAASVLKSRGRDRVANLSGGYSAWVGGGGRPER